MRVIWRGDFVNEIDQFKEFIRGEDKTHTRALLQLIRLPACYECKREHSFSKLSLVKNRLRSSVDQDRLSDLTLMSIESDVLLKISFTSLIEDFAA